MHTDMTIVTCTFEDCSKTFRRTNQLNIHMRTHTGKSLTVAPIARKRICKSVRLSITRERIQAIGGMSATMMAAVKRLQDAILYWFICESTRAKNLTAAMSETAESPLRNHRDSIPSVDTKVRSPSSVTMVDAISDSWLHELTSYLRSHMGEKPFVCRECRKSFSTSSYLQVHKRINTNNNLHSGLKPYASSKCPKRFTQGGSSKIHEKCI